jgi:Ca2+-transporting ATPase
MRWHILFVGLLIGIVTLAIQAWAVSTGNPKGQTMAFSVLCFSQLGHVLAIRSNKIPLFKSGLLSNKAMLFAIALTVLFQMMIIYMPVLNKIFKTQALSLKELSLTIAASCLVFIAVELEKTIRYIKTNNPQKRKG